LIVLKRLAADYEVIEVLLMTSFSSKGKKNFKFLQCPRSQNSET